jgi:hypothetical protein
VGFWSSRSRKGAADTCCVCVCVCERERERERIGRWSEWEEIFEAAGAVVVAVLLLV